MTIAEFVTGKAVKDEAMVAVNGMERMHVFREGVGVAELLKLRLEEIPSLITTIDDSGVPRRVRRRARSSIFVIAHLMRRSKSGLMVVFMSGT